MSWYLFEEKNLNPSEPNFMCRVGIEYQCMLYN